MSLEPKPMEAGERLLTELSRSPAKEVLVKQLPNGMLVWNPAYDLSNKELSGSELEKQARLR